MYTLYYVPNATSLATHIVLEWCGADYKTVAMEFGDDILFKLSPIGTAGSVARDDGKPAIKQTPAILQYLARVFPQTNLGSDGSLENSLIFEQWLNFLVSDVHHAFHLLFNPARYGIENNDPAREAALSLCYRNFGILESHLEGRDFVIGNSKTIVDAYLFPMIRWTYVVFSEDARDYPNIYAFHDRMRCDASVEKVLRDEGTWAD